MTEASHQMTSNPLPKHGDHRPGTVGKAQGSVQVSKGRLAYPGLDCWIRCTPAFELLVASLSLARA